MAFMNWSDNYLTGIEVVDHQHKGLVNLINQAAPILTDDQLHDRAAAAPLLDALVHYVDEHFSTEEEVMRQGGIDPRHLIHHQKLHQGFAAQVDTLRRQFEEGDSLNGNELLRFLSNWLAFHILGEDQRMSRELRAITGGMGAAEAYDNVEGNKAEILQGANEVLVDALVNLFAQMTEQNRELVEKNRKIEAAHHELDLYRLQLEEQVSQRTAELQKTNLELLGAKELAESAIIAKTRFLGTMSHELLTPLNAILGFAHLLEGADLPLKQHEQVKRILVAGERLHTLVNEVLQFSRLDMGEITIDEYAFDPAILLQDVASHIRKVAEDKSLELKISIEPGLGVLQGDELHLRQVLQALASNAVKFTEAGTVTLSARHLARESQRMHVVFEVSDTGIGIAQERQSQLFRAFEQLDPKTTRRHGGIGLGLVISARLAKLMGGDLSVESTPGQGSRFRIALWLNIADNAVPAAGILPDAGIQIAPEQLQQALEVLESLLAADDMEARKRFFQLEPYLQDFSGPLLEELARQIDQYEFDKALHTLRKMAGFSARPDHST